MTILLSFLIGKRKEHMTKKRDPSWKWLRALTHKAIPPKKGRASYNRKKIKAKEIQDEKDQTTKDNG